LPNLLPTNPDYGMSKFAKVVFIKLYFAERWGTGVLNTTLGF